MRLQPFAKGFIGCFSIVGTLRSVEVVEVFSCAEICVEINLTFVSQELIELLLVWAMGSLDLADQFRCSTIDVSMTTVALIFDIPVERSLELMSVIGTGLYDAKRALIDDVIGDGDRVCLFVPDGFSRRAC